MGGRTADRTQGRRRFHHQIIRPGSICPQGLAKAPRQFQMQWFRTGPILQTVSGTGKHHKTIQQMVAIRALARNVQIQVDLGVSLFCQNLC